MKNIIPGFSKKSWFLALIGITILLRLGLAIINPEENDNHAEVIRLWIENETYPALEDCEECFQPPAYYGIVKFCAIALKMTNYQAIRSVFKGLNFILTLIFIFQTLWFHQHLSIPDHWKRLLSLFWIFNPKIIAMGAQATNDFVLIVVALAMIQLLRWMQQKVLLKHLVLGTLLAIFAGTTKGTGLVLSIFWFASWTFMYIYQSKLKQLLYIIPLIIFSTIFIAHYGLYYKKYVQYQNAFQINRFKEPAAPWFTPDSSYNHGRPGVITLQETFTSFKIISLIKEPYNLNERTNYPAHRRSYISQFYGQFSNALFERHPWLWINYNATMMHFASANYFLILPLFLLLIIGIIQTIKSCFSNLKWDENKMYLMLLIGFLFLLAKATAEYRDFSFMKWTYIMGAMPAYYYFLSKGIANFIQKKLFSKVLTINIIWVIVLFSVNLYFLFNTLLKNML